MDWSFLIKNKESLNVTTDSRKITPGCVFVALKGEHFDGNQFVAQALELGAAYAITDAEQPLTCSQAKDYNERIIRVDNSLLALQDLARAWRRTLDIPVIAITGTNGKTTTKELTAAVIHSILIAYCDSIFAIAILVSSQSICAFVIVSILVIPFVFANSYAC